MIKMNKDIMNVILYTRVSTKEQVEGYSLSSQEKVCRDYAKKQGWNVVEIFEEQGESAKTADRTQLLKLLEYCSRNKGKIDALLVYKLDRFARDSSDHHTIRAALSRYGMVLRSVTENIDETSTGKFMENMFAAVNQFDNDVRADRTRAGMKEKVRQGLWSWAPPMGYKSSSAGMIIDKEKAPFIRQAFEIYATGNYTIREIAKRFNKWGIKTKKGNRISPQAATRILENKLYMGVIAVKGWQDEVVGVHERIVSPELFCKVQAVRRGKSTTAVPRLVNNPEFPLKNITKCLDCGKYLTASKSTGRSQRYAYYHCTCGKIRVGKKVLEDSFFDFLKQIQPNKDFIKLFKEILVEVWKKKQGFVFEEQRKMDKDLVFLREMKRRLIEKNLQGIISDEDYKEQIESIGIRITIKEVERSEIKMEESNIDYLVSVSEELFNKVSTIWLDAPFEHKLKFQHLLFPKGIVYKDENIGTEELGLPFKLITDAEVKKTTLVALTGFEPVIFTLRR